ncbi:MAG: hypothetical protein WBQ32_12305 [Ignavibacteriaceae bacterium]
MDKTKINRIIILFIFSTLSGCVPSLVYSPSINLPPKPLQKEKAQILGGVGYFPETQPDRVSSKMAIGGETTIRYAFSNSYAMQIEGWYDFSSNVEDGRWGLSIASIIVFNDSSNYRFGLMPIFAAALADNSVEGGGCYIPATFWFNHIDPLNFYAAIGPVVGIRDISDEHNQWGWGIIINAGCGILFNDNITMNLEFACIKQVNEYRGRQDYFFSPSINIGYIF